MIEMREVQRMRWSEIDAALNRSAGGSNIKYDSLRRPKLPSMHQNDAGGRVTISEEQKAERLARSQAAALRDVTAELMGDPPPGFTGLDKRMAGGVAR